MITYLPTILQSPVSIQRALLITSNLQFSRSFIFSEKNDKGVEKKWSTKKNIGVLMSADNYEGVQLVTVAVRMK